MSEIEITDEDLVPLELFDQALAMKQHKFEDKNSYVIALIQDAKIEVSKKITALGVDTEKTKRTIEQSIFINYLNSRLESTHLQIFACHYKNQSLY